MNLIYNKKEKSFYKEIVKAKDLEKIRQQIMSIPGLKDYLEEKRKETLDNLIDEQIIG